MTPAPAFFLAFWLFFLAAGQSKLLRDPGTLWHTKVGEKVLAEGFFTGDPYTFTHAGHRWVPHQWLGEVVMAYAYRISGFDTFVLLAATILAALFTWLSMRLRNTGLNLAVVAVIAGGVLAVTATHLHVRPLLMTTVGMTILAIWLSEIEAGKTSLKRLIWLIPLFIVWTNMHGGMLGGLLALALVIGGWIAWRILGWPSPVKNAKSAMLLILLVVLCAGTMFVNPYGWEIPRAWFIIMNAPKLTELIEEHQPLDLAKPENWGVVLLGAAYLFVLAGVRGKMQVVWLLPLFWLVQSFLRVRHTPLFALTAFATLATLWPATRWAELLKAKRRDFYDPDGALKKAGWLDWAIPMLLVAMSLVLQSNRVEVPLVGHNWAKLDAERWPVEILDTIQGEPWWRPSKRVFNECTFGGFLIFYAPQYEIFVDDRAELFGDDFLAEFVRGGTVGTDAAMQGWTSRFGEFDYALIAPGTPFDEWFRKHNWKLLASCPTANFYQKP